MAYYLQTFGGVSNVDLGSPITGLSGDFEIRFSVSLVDSEGIVLGGGSSALIFFRSGSRLEIRRSGTTTFNLPSDPVGNLFEYSIVGSAANDNVKLYQDGVEFGTLTGAFFYDLTNLIGPFQNSTRDLDFYSAEIFKSGTLTNEYFKDTLNGSDDRVFPDIQGGNDGILASGYPTDNSQWIFYSEPSAGVTADVTEISVDALESSSVSVSANITASVTEVSTDAAESSATTITTTISASITELTSDASESSSAAITNNLITLTVTEVANDFSESVSASIAGIVGVVVTELNANASESSAADISANIAAAVTEIAADFEDNSSINFVGSFTVEVTETSTDFEEACYIQLPVMRLIPRKTISVSKRSSTIRVNKRNHTIRVR